jgi:PEP-CTERM motif
MKTVMFCVLTVGALTMAAQAADITWQAPQTISGPNDVSTLGTYFGSWTPYSYNPQPPINGVQFDSDLPGATQTFDNAGGSGTYTDPGTSDTAYNYILTSALFGNTAGPYSVSWDSMTPGNTYLVEVWVNDARNIGQLRSETITGGANTSDPLFYGSNPDGTGPGQYIIGTFTADNTGAQAISFNGYSTGSSPSAQMNVILVRELVPEPSTFAFLAAGVGAMFLVLRRRNASVQI